MCPTHSPDWSLSSYDIFLRPVADFKSLRAEVKDKSAELRHLKMELREQLLRDIGRLLDDQPHMEALEASLDQGLCSGGQVEPLDGPAGSVLECLVLPSGELVLKLAEPISYLLGALTALTETQQKLLAEALETRMLLKQLELVRGHGPGDVAGAPWVHPGRLTLACAAEAWGSGYRSTPYNLSPPLLVGGADLGAEHPMAGAELCVPAPQPPREQLG
ncbi:gasdermin-D-like [Peromyscus maniculatus bairdii]|uniref:gasdermin-D-like n=1 Tax=Peromyscus maniculatus bairdii TaxID=230844 RepID=UPI003FD58A8E